MIPLGSPDYLPLGTPEYLTLREVAGLFVVDVETARRWAQAGRLRGSKTPGGHWRFRAADIAVMLWLGA